MPDENWRMIRHFLEIMKSYLKFWRLHFSPSCSTVEPLDSGAGHKALKATTQVNAKKRPDRQVAAPGSKRHRAGGRRQPTGARHAIQVNRTYAIVGR